MSGTLFYPWNLEQDQLPPLPAPAAHQEPEMPKWLAPVNPSKALVQLAQPLSLLSRGPPFNQVPCEPVVWAMAQLFEHFYTLGSVLSTSEFR